jgi:hypothetical protein
MNRALNLIIASLKRFKSLVQRRKRRVHIVKAGLAAGKARGGRLAIRLGRGDLRHTRTRTAPASSAPSRRSISSSRRS